jgi:hypothetical protein
MGLSKACLMIMGLPYCTEIIWLIGCEHAQSNTVHKLCLRGIIHHKTKQLASIVPENICINRMHTHAHTHMQNYSLHKTLRVKWQQGFYSLPKQYNKIGRFEQRPLLLFDVVNCDMLHDCIV